MNRYLPPSGSEVGMVYDELSRKSSNIGCDRCECCILCKKIVYVM